MRGRGWLLAALLLCCSGPAAPPVATYRGGDLSAADYASWLRFRKLEDGPATRPTAVRELVVLETLAAAAEARGAAADPAVAAQLAEAESKILGRELDRWVNEAITVTQAELDRARESYPDAFHKPRRVRLRNIFKRFPSEADAAQRRALRRELEEVRAKLAAGRDFAELATESSDSETRFRGGLMGNVDPARLRPDVRGVVQDLGPGELSPVVETPDGVSLFLCEEVLPPVVPAPEEMDRKFESNLRGMRRKELRRRLDAELLAQAAPRYDLSAVSAAEPANGDPIVVGWSGGSLRLGALGTVWTMRGDPRQLDELAPSELEAALRALVLERQAAARARSLGLDRSPGVAEELRWRRRQILGTDELRFRVQQRLQRIGEDEVRAYYEAHGDELETLPRFDLEGLLFAPSGSDPRAARLAAYRASEELAGRPAGIARWKPRSTAGFAVHHRDLGWLSRRQLASLGPNVWKTVLGMRPGAISPVVPQDGRYWILHLRRVEPGRPLRFEEAAPAIERRLGNRRVEALSEAIQAELADELQIVVAPAGDEPPLED